MIGKHIKQINNLVITKSNEVYFVWSPYKELLYRDYQLRNCELYCSKNTLYLKVTNSQRTLEQVKNLRPTVIEQSEINKARQLINQGTILIYHGTKKPNLTPNFNYVNTDNDYGKGFYTTPDKELGKEWAYAQYTPGTQGYLYTYQIDLSKLNVLNLTEYDSLLWVAELLAHRHINTDGREALQDTISDFIAKYKIDTSKFDVIIGYRADDSYFTYASDFVSGNIYKATLENALRYGDLGLQVFIKSQKAFDMLKSVGTAELVDKKYESYYKNRDVSARDKYRIARDSYNKSVRVKQRITDFL